MNKIAKTADKILEPSYSAHTLIVLMVKRDSAISQALYLIMSKSSTVQTCTIEMTSYARSSALHLVVD